MRPIRILALPCSLALLAGCDQPPADDPADDVTEEVSAAATAEQFFDTSAATEDNTGITSYGIKAGLIEGFIVDPEATYRLSLGTPGGNHTTTGKIIYRVAGHSVTVNLTAKFPDRATIALTGTASGKSFSFRCDSREGSSGTPWSVPGAVEFESRFLYQDVLGDWASRRLQGLPLGTFNGTKCRISTCLTVVGEARNSDAVAIVGRLGVFTYCDQ